MSSQNQGVILSSASEPPMRRKRGRPRKDEIVQGDNSPVTPASEILNKNKHSVETNDSASDDMVGQMVSGVIEGSFDAGYLLNVKVGETNTHLRGIVFLPGRFTPITATNDVAPQAKMYKRKEIPFPFVSPQGQLHPVSPTSGKSEKPVEHKNDTPKPLDQGLRIGPQCGATAANENQSASSLIPPASNLPINETGLPLEQKDLQDIITDVGLQNGKSVGFEAFKPMKAPNNNVDAPKAPEPVPAMFTASLPVTETENLKPQVEHQAVSSEKLVGDAKSLDLVNDQKPNYPDPEPQAMPCEHSGINMFVKQASKFSELETQVMPCETTGINMFGKQASRFPEPQAIPCEPTGINMFGKQGSQFPELQAIPREPTGINMFGNQASQFPESQAIPREHTGINMFRNQASQFPEPQSITREPTGISMFGKQASLRQDVDVSQDTQLELANKIMTGVGVPHTGVLFASDVATTTVTAACSASMNSLPIMIFGAETIPSGNKPATEESGLPRMVVPEVSSPSMAINTNNVESNVKDAIPPAQS